MLFSKYKVEILTLKKDVKKTPFNSKSDYEEIYSFSRSKVFANKKEMFEDAQRILDKVSELSKEDENYKEFDYFGGLGRLLDVYLQDDGSAEFTRFEVRRYDYLIILTPFYA